MLAKEIKMANIKKQREFIKAQLKKVSLTNNDGDTSYPYVGHLFPEVKQYFKKEGFKIVEFNNDTIASLTKGRSIHLFTVNDETVLLSYKELEEAENNFETTDEMLTRVVKESGIENPFEAIFADALGISLSSENGEDSEHSAMFDFLSLMGKYGTKTSEDIDDSYEDEP